MDWEPLPWEGVPVHVGHDQKNTKARVVNFYMTGNSISSHYFVKVLLAFWNLALPSVWLDSACGPLCRDGDSQQMS